MKTSQLADLLLIKQVGPNWRHEIGSIRGYGNSHRWYSASEQDTRWFEVRLLWRHVRQDWISILW